MDNIFKTLKLFFTNYALISAAVAWLTAQLFKVMTGVFKHEKFRLTTLLFGTGGMPSSHTAAVIALFVACFIKLGPDSVYVAIAGVLSMIVIRDATGVRREMGEQAKIINQIISENDNIETQRELRERVGHTPKQVLIGCLIGLVMPILLSFAPVFKVSMDWLG